MSTRYVKAGTRTARKAEAQGTVSSHSDAEHVYVLPTGEVVVVVQRPDIFPADLIEDTIPQKVKRHAPKALSFVVGLITGIPI